MFIIFIQDGGAFCIKGGETTLDGGCTIAFNKDYYGAISTNSGVINIYSALFRDNTPRAIYNHNNRKMIASNLTFIKNGIGGIKDLKLLHPVVFDTASWSDTSTLQGCSTVCPTLSSNSATSNGIGTCVLGQYGIPVCKCDAGSKSSIQLTFGCEPCKRGEYGVLSNSGKGLCKKCQDGKYQPNQGANHCCPNLKHISPSPSPSPSPFPSIYNGANIICAGHGACYASGEKNGTCLCDKGYKGSNCDQCDLNYFGDSLRTGFIGADLQCKPCPGGVGNACNGHGKCSHGASGNGTCECDATHPNPTRDGESNPYCSKSIQCPPNSQLSYHSAKQCECIADFFDTNRDFFPENTNCIKCDERAGINCASSSKTITDVKIQSEYWEIVEDLAALGAKKKFESALDIPVKPCLIKDVCIGPVYSLNGTGCRTGHMGPLCSVCKLDHIKELGGYCASEAKCNNDLTAFTTLVSIAFIAIIWYTLFVKTRCKAITLRTVACFKRLLRRIQKEKTFERETKIKIIVGFVQIVSQFFSTFEMVFNGKTEQKIRAIAAPLNLNPFGLAPVRCFYKNANFIDQFYVTCIMPLIICFFIIPLVAVMFAKGKTRAKSMKARVDMCFRLLNVCLFLIYPSICATVFKMLNPCREIANGNLYLKVDYSIRCSGNGFTNKEFDDAYNFALFMLIMIPIGAPMFFFLQLFIKRKSLWMRGGETDEKGESLVVSPHTYRRLGALYMAYSTRCWYWESIELFRKLAITGLIVLCYPGTVYQFVCACGILLGSITLYALVRPYRDLSNDYLQISCNIAMLCIAFAGLLVRRKQEDKDVNENTISQILIICPIALFAYVLLYTIRRPGAKLVVPESEHKTKNNISFSSKVSRFSLVSKKKASV